MKLVRGMYENVRRLVLVDGGLSEEFEVKVDVHQGSVLSPLLVITWLLLGHPKPKKMLIFRFVGIFEYIILLMLILFLDMCQNS